MDASQCNCCETHALRWCRENAQMRDSQLPRTYPVNMRSGNPFASCPSAFSTNGLLLADPRMRQLAMVSSSDRAVAAVYHYYPKYARY